MIVDKMFKLKSESDECKINRKYNMRVKVMKVLKDIGKNRENKL